MRKERRSTGQVCDLKTALKSKPHEIRKTYRLGKKSDHGDLIKDYGRPVPYKLYFAFMWVTDFIYETHQHLVTSLDQPWLLPQYLRTFADAIHQKGGALTNCWGFVDGTVRPICRPGMDQVMYNGHKQIHALKFQSATAPNGLTAHLFGPVEGRRHDAYSLRESRLLPELENRSQS